MFIPPYRISLSGGGIKAFAHVGVLEVLNGHGYLRAVREYIGISAGALCALCMCIGCTISELKMLISVLDFDLVRDISPETIMDFPESFGLDTGENMKKLIHAVLRAKHLSPDITFSELRDKGLGPQLRVIATNVNTCMTQEFSNTVSPSVKVAFAVQASMSIPLYFIPPRDPSTGHYFVDGGLLCSSPIYFMTEEECKYTLAVSFDNKHKPKEKIGGLSEFIAQIYYTTDYKQQSELYTKWKNNTILICCGRLSILDFDSGFEQRKVLFEAGREAAENFLKTPVPSPRRRFSIS
jgi:NTE family protein